MPSGVHGAMDQCGSKNGSGSAPRPAVENSRDGRQNHIAPIWESQIGYVGEAKQDRSGPPAGNFAFGRAGQKILQQATKEKLFRPGGEEKNAQRSQREGLPFVPLRLKLNEVHA